MFANVIDGADAGVVQRGGGAGFAPESFERGGISREVRREELQRDWSSQTRILCSKHLAHATAPHRFEDAVMRNGLPNHDGCAKKGALLNPRQVGASLQAAKKRRSLL